MKKFLTCLLAVLVVLPSMLVLSGCKEDKKTKVAGAYGDLPVVKINTEDGKKPKDKENYVNCSFEITNCADETHNFKVTMKDTYDYEEDGGGVGVRLRGNTTMKFDKKPYRIKFEKKKSLFGLPKAKSWVLLADYLDQSNIRNYTAMTLGNEAFFYHEGQAKEDQIFTATPHHVVLEFNGEYKGVYLLCEQMDEKEGRANVEVDDLYTNYEKTEFPFLIEMDQYAKSDKTVAEKDKLLLDGYHPIEIKYPEAKDRGLHQDEDIIYDYMTEYLTAVKQTLKTGEKVSVSFRPNPVGFEDLVDVQSLIDYNLLNEFMYNPDSVWKSSYMHKSINVVDPDTNEVTEYGKLKFGPIWDFDWSMSNAYTGHPYTESFIECARDITVFNRSVFFEDFLKNEDNYELVQDRWDEISDRINLVNTKLRDYKAYISEASKFDAIMWYGLTGDFEFDMQYDYVRLFMLDRQDYFDEIFELNHSAFLTEAKIIVVQE